MSIKVIAGLIDGERDCVLRLVDRRFFWGESWWIGWWCCQSGCFWSDVDQSDHRFDWWRERLCVEVGRSKIFLGGKLVDRVMVWSIRLFLEWCQSKWSEVWLMEREIVCWGWLIEDLGRYCSALYEHSTRARTRKTKLGCHFDYWGEHMLVHEWTKWQPSFVFRVQALFQCSCRVKIPYRAKRLSGKV